MKKVFAITSVILLSLIGVQSKAQSNDTLKVMVYNLLNYRYFSSFCTQTNNSSQTKENALELILDHTSPDVFVAVEMGASPNGLNAYTLLNNSFNKNGISYYNMANYTVSGGSNLTNMLYFNSDKLVLESQTTVTKGLNNLNLIRLIDIYTLYYKDPNLAVHNDTTYFHFIAAHLKAGNTTADRNERAEATEAVMAHLDSINATGNYFFMGDFNLYTYTEPAFLDMVLYSPDPGLNFYDPVNRVGNWSNNSSYTDVHTQSTRTSGGCGASGGMDDRFDFILASDEVMNNTDKVEYIPNTYWALGQDGNRFNGSINSPINNTVPSYIANALYDMSDHLPVMMDVKVTLPSATAILEQENKVEIVYTNPVKEELLIQVTSGKENLSKISLLDITGKVVKEINWNDSRNQKINLSDLKRGTYFIKVGSKTNVQFIKKLIKI